MTSDIPAAEGRCFEFAFHAIHESEDGPLGGVRLCHGIVRGTGGRAAGIRYTHAWLESPLGICIDCGSGERRTEFLPKELYYAQGSIDPLTVRSYSRDEARRLVVKHEHYGPWDPALLAFEPTKG